MKPVRLSPRRLLAGAAAILGVLVVGAGILYFWLLADLPPARAAELRAARPTTQILDRNGKLLYEVLDTEAGKQIDLALSHIPAACVQATVATEDRRFFRHAGVDILAIGRAFWQNLRTGATFSGGSTLTQQLARNLLLSADERYEPTLRRKLREAWLAWRLEQVYSKDQLLALYLNQTYYGNFAFGIEAAAQVFFAKPARQLSRAECALLAGLVQYPTGYNPLQDPTAAKERQLTVLRLMRQAGYLTDAERAEVANEPLQYRSHLFDIEAPHFVMYVQDLLTEQLGADRLRLGGLRVHTTLDLDLQRQAEASIRRRLDQLTCRTPGACDASSPRNRRVDNAAAVVLDSRSGEILTMVGSPDYFSRAISGNVNAALSLRQPGSAIKPFTYAAALDPRWSARAGQPPLTAASILPDLSTAFKVKNVDGAWAAYRPLNYDRTFHGPVSVRTALANSYNIPAVAVLERIGVETLRALASEAGIRTFSGRYGLALTLGGGDVRLLELTAAYGIFDDGHPLVTRAILSVEEDGPDGANLAQDPHDAAVSQALPPVISPQAAYIITNILADDVARIPAFGANSVLRLPFPAAVKTGTTTDWRDNWTVGYSTARLVGVWVGNADNSPMVDVSGVDGAGPIWHDLMLLAHPTQPGAFPRPDQLVEAEICAPSGLLPTADCPRTRRELFIAGTQPTVPDDQFRQIAVDRATGEPATATTPPERRGERVFWVLPPEYYDWMAAQGYPLPPSEALAAVATPAADEGRQFAAASLRRPNAPLQLVSPAPVATYQMHPRLPAGQQRLAVSGITADGRPWQRLRLVVDGAVLLEGENAARLETWWPLTLGSHEIWLEGELRTGAATVRSAPAAITVEEFQIERLALEAP
jgi:penicillin-binding protein 1C